MSEEQAKNTTPTKKVAKKRSEKSIDNRQKMAKLCERDKLGLFANKEYKFKEDGFVDWKAMIPLEYFVFNKSWFESNNIEIPSAENLSEIENPDDYNDQQILILLGGIKEVAKIRGIKSVNKKIIESNPDRCVASTTVEFLPNYENPEGLIVEGVANATSFNTSENFQVYLETIASNRSFVRAVRNALRIDIVGSDELADTQYESGTQEAGAIKPSTALAEAAAQYTATLDEQPTNLDTFEKFRRYLLSKKVEEAHNWEDWDDIPIPSIWKFLSQINKSITKNK